MDKKQLPEFALLTVFVLSGVCTLAKVPHAHSLALLSGGLLSMLYFYGSYWLFKQADVSAITRVVAGFSYAMVIISCLFCLMHWQFWKVFMGVACVGLAVTAGLSLSKYKSAAHLAHLCRCILFLIILSLLYSYRHFHI